MNNLNKTVNLGILRKLKKTSALSISLLIIISTMSIFGAASIQVTAAADTFTFGNTSIGTMTNSFTTDRDASRFQLTQNGQLQTITAYYTNTGFSAKTAIYTDNNGAPSNLIAQSNSQTITQNGWQTFTLPQTTLTPGYYWLCTVSSNPSYGTMTPTTTNQHAWKYSPYTSEYPTTFGTPAGYQQTATSIYATCTTTTTIVNPTPTPTPTSTPAPTTAPTPAPDGGTAQITVSAAVASSYSGTHTPSQAIDAIESTANYWGTSSANGLPQWLQLDLGTQKSISQIVTHFYDGNSRTYTYYIQVSTDGSNWNTVEPTKTGNSVVTDSFAQTTCRYVRITITGNTANLAAHIEEIKIYQSGNSSPTSTPTPTQTPYPTPTPPTANYGSNGIWTQAGSDLAPSQCSYYKQQKITEIYMQVGYWKSDSSLYYLVSSSQIQTAVANAHAAGLKIYAWVTSQASYGATINIGSSSLRQTAINNMVNLARDYNFDGIADDLEELQCSGYSDYVSYFNGAASALHSIGKQYFTAVVAYLPPNMGASTLQHHSRRQNSTHAIRLSVWTARNQSLKEHVDFFLRYSSSPVGLAIHSDHPPYGTLVDAMSWVDEQLATGTPTGKLAGVDIFWVHGMTQSQWNAWSYWNTKN